MGIGTIRPEKSRWVRLAWTSCSGQPGYDRCCVEKKLKGVKVRLGAVTEVCIGTSILKTIICATVPEEPGRASMGVAVGRNWGLASRTALSK